MTRRLPQELANMHQSFVMSYFALKPEAVAHAPAGAPSRPRPRDASSGALLWVPAPRRRGQTCTVDLQVGGRVQHGKGRLTSAMTTVRPPDRLCSRTEHRRQRRRGLVVCCRERINGARDKSPTRSRGASAAAATPLRHAPFLHLPLPPAHAGQRCRKRPGRGPGGAIPGPPRPCLPDGPRHSRGLA